MTRKRLRSKASAPQCSPLISEDRKRAQEEEEDDDAEEQTNEEVKDKKDDEEQGEPLYSETSHFAFTCPKALTRRLLVRGALCIAAVLAIAATMAERRNLQLADP